MDGAGVAGVSHRLIRAKWQMLGSRAVGYWCRRCDDPIALGELVGAEVIMIKGLRRAEAPETEASVGTTVGRRIWLVLGYANKGTTYPERMAGHRGPVPWFHWPKKPRPVALRCPQPAVVRCRCGTDNLVSELSASKAQAYADVVKAARDLMAVMPEAVPEPLRRAILAADVPSTDGNVVD